MPPSSGELWGHHLMPLQVDVDCLLPTGIIIPLRCNRDATLERIKADLWKEAGRYPLHNKLLDAASYIFVSITQDAEKEEFYDETRRLCDLRLFQPILKIVEPKGNREEKMLNYEIGMTIGIPVSDFNEIKDLEVMTFRRNILEVCQDAFLEREVKSKHSLALYAYAPDVESSSKLPPNLLNKYETGMIVCIWVVSEDNNRAKYSVKVPETAKPSEVIAEAIRRRSTKMNITKEHAERCIDEYGHTYALKVCGSDLFLLSDDYPMSQYKHIRECMASNKIPQLMLLTKESIYGTIPENKFIKPTYVQKGIQKLAEINSVQTMSLWDIHANLKVRINCATSVNIRELGKIYVKAQIFHGTEPLCEAQHTKQVDSNNPRWNEWLEFFYIPDIPLSARLCLSICCISTKRKNRKQVHYALAWGNLQMFDFNKLLMSEKVSLQMWPMPQGMDELLNHIGIPGSNPDKECPCLEIEFDRFSHPVAYPPDEHFSELAQYVAKRDENTHIQSNEDQVREEEMLLEILERDPLSEISEQDKDLLWKRRDLCRQHPNSLPKLLQAVKWNDREHIAQMYLLLDQWPLLSAEVALELLDCTFTDLNVRKFAVYCMEKMLTDDKLHLYLLQLVQALKFEPYLDSAITRFLLKRALINQRIGQFFFWHLKSEMHQTSIRIRFGLVLEAFCRGSGPYLRNLSKQVEALDKLRKLTEMLKSDVRDDHNEQMKVLHEQLQQADYQEALTSFVSPLNNSHRLGELDQENCDVKTSKKRPLNLKWHNPDPLADIGFTSYRIIFKNGDDLRQDMLTLQVIRIMDSIWKNEGMDLRMIPYGCMATGKEIGLIEVVRDAETIMKIQRMAGAKSTYQLDPSQLHKWIKEKNRDRYELAIDAFTRSCAGYCVATFILGIGDRHSENIMVTEQGQVFHIDFGHFLDHRKKKFGINRERVPFVLTEDFIRVIAKGKENPRKCQEFVGFQELCCDAYRLLRKHANLLISLFTMMLSCGIPELQSLDDIGYIRKTLGVEKTEKQALEYFISQLRNAYGDSWTTKIDWLFHAIRN